MASQTTLDWDNSDMAGLQDLLSWMDSKRRVAGRNLSDLINDPANALEKTADNTLQTVKELPDDPANFLGVGMMKVVGPQSAALRLAQQRAALPVEQHGLGLAANNTPQMRAAAMGFDAPAYHSSLEDIKRFNPTGRFAGNLGVSGVSVTDSAEMASRYLDRYANQGWVNGVPNQPFDKNILPLMVNEGNVLESSVSPFKSPVRMGFPLPDGYVNPMVPRGIDTLKVPDSINRNGVTVKHSDGKNAIRGIESVISNPDNIRSRFAAFDPWRRNAAIASAMGVAAPDLLAAENPDSTRSLKDLIGKE